MGDKTLAATFNNLDEAAMRQLGRSLGGLAQKLYEGRHNLQADPESGHEVLYVCVGGFMGAGKSTLSASMLESNAAMDKAVPQRRPLTVALSHDIDESREVTVYETRRSQAAHQENRLRDCWLTEPFRSSTLSSKCAVPRRRYPGIEILEHPEKVPLAAQGLRVNVWMRREGRRDVSIVLPNAKTGMLPSWKAFLRDARQEELAL